MFVFSPQMRVSSSLVCFFLPFEFFRMLVSSSHLSFFLTCEFLPAASFFLTCEFLPDLFAVPGEDCVEVARWGQGPATALQEPAGEEGESECPELGGRHQAGGARREALFCRVGRWQQQDCLFSHTHAEV